MSANNFSGCNTNLKVTFTYVEKITEKYSKTTKKAIFLYN